MKATVQRAFEWEDTELYRSLCQWLPEMRTRSRKVLDVKALAAQMSVTTEGIYKWLRGGRILSRDGADRLFKVIVSSTNLEALERAETPAPTAQDVIRFLIS